MCGIVCYWAKEAVLTINQYDKLLEGASLRGGDGVGVLIYDQYILPRTQYWTQPYSSCKKDVLKFITRYMNKGCILFVQCRATPETEPETTSEMLQPIIRNSKILVHNGGVTDSLKNEIPKFNLVTQIDSEGILAAYEQHDCNMKETMKHLVGSFAFVMLDYTKNKLYAVTSFNPLAHMYIRGYGYFLHSDNEVLSSVLEDITGQTSDGVNVWESWYHHYIDGYTIIETDLESGFQFKTTYEPRFLHPTWNSLENKKRKKTLVVCSGGIDSGLTAWVLKKVGRDICLVHFVYGAKAQECEETSIISLAGELNSIVYKFNISEFYKVIGEKGMLTSDEIPIDSGGDFIKSTIAWCSGRNSIFASMTMALAESLITSGKYDEVDIAAGWSQLSEECLTNNMHNRVSTVDRGRVNPYDVKEEDWLWGCDIKTHRVQKTQVKEVRKRIVNSVFRVYCNRKYGKGTKSKHGGYVECSGSHPFYVKNKGWVRAKDLKKGDIIYRKDHECLESKLWGPFYGKDLKKEKNPMWGHIRSNQKVCWCGKLHRSMDKEEHSKKMKEVMSNPSVGKKISKSLRKLIDGPNGKDYLQKVRVEGKKGIARFREKDPKWGAARMEPGVLSKIMMKSIEEGRNNPAKALEKPTISEMKLIQVFDSWWGEDREKFIRYVGDGQIWITSEGKHMNPDFLFTGQKKLIEVWGDYWHTEEEMNERKRKYKGQGWNCLLLNWDYIWKNVDEIRKIIEDFGNKEHQSYISNGMEVVEVEEIKGKREVVNYHCEPYNNFFVNSLLVHNTGGYPDNSFKFNELLEQLKMYGYITGSRINFLPVMQRVTKTEEWVLGEALKFPFELTTSCDAPKMIGGVPHLCTECGSTKLSILASDRAGVKDPRKFIGERPTLSNTMKTASVHDIISRLQLSEEEKKLLRNL